MLKETIKFEDFDGVQREQIFYFNLTQIEILELEARHEGDLSAKIRRIGETGDAEKVMHMFKDVLAKAYGVRTPEGGFRKSQELFDEFATTEAYSELVMGFLTQPGRMAQFVAGLVSGTKKLTPAQVEEAIQKGYEQAGIQHPGNLFQNQEEERAASAPFSPPPSTTGPRPPVRPTQQ